MEGGDAQKTGAAPPPPVENAPAEVSQQAGPDATGAAPPTAVAVPVPQTLQQSPATPEPDHKDQKKDPKEQQKDQKDKKPGEVTKPKDAKGKGKGEPPGSPPAADEKKRGGAQSLSRDKKDALNRSPSPVGKPPTPKNDAAAKAKKKRSLKNELAKRQEKPISFIDCPICHKILKYAVETECGHIFCSGCLNKKMGRQKRCPVCKQDIESVHPSYVMRELVSKFGGRDGHKRLKSELLNVPGYYDEYALEDPIVVAAQFVPGASGGLCSSAGGAFDPSDLYKVTKLEEFVSSEEYLDTVKTVNQIIASWTSGSMKSCFGSICSCFLPSQAQQAVNMIEVVLGDCNLRWPETGLYWTLMYLDGDASSARSLNDRFFLAMRIDRFKARLYQKTILTSGYKKDAEMARLRKQNALMRHKMLELGEHGLVRALAGRKSPRYAVKTGPSLMFVNDYPDFPVISPHTLRELVLHNPSSKKYFIAPWNRVRSTSTGPLPLTRDEDCRMRSQFHALVAPRSGSPYDSSRTGSPSCGVSLKGPNVPAGQKLQPTFTQLRPWR